MRKLHTFHPLLQLAMLITLGLLASNIPGTAPYLTGLYATLLAAWTLGLLWALRGIDPGVRICSQETSLSITSAVWNVLLAVVLGVAVSGVLIALALGLVLYRGWRCHAWGSGAGHWWQPA